MKQIRIYLVVLMALAAPFSFAQKIPNKLSNLRSKIIHTKDAVIYLDSSSIIPNSVTISGVLPSAYSVNYVTAQLSWIKTPPQDSVQVTYRIFSIKLNAVTRHLNFDSVQNFFLADKQVRYNFNAQQKNSLIDFGNMDYTGSIGRGISFGNNQDAVLSSSMNLQLHGFIGDSLEVSAAISDNNIPVQPDGNTQNIQDFDKILLQVKMKGWQANFGDIDIRQNKSYFLNFFSRMQGASFITENKINKNGVNTLTLSGAVAKGILARNVITPIDGNQGPYHLQGNNNETYLTVLAGTEKVYIDGQLLQRGANQDYTINYNTAEITFMPKQIITKDSRIEVEFEYSNQNYLNSNFYVNDELKVNKRLSFNFGLYSNQDAKNSPISQPLDTNEKQFLANIGNNITQAYYPVATLDTFSAATILYKKVDTSYKVRNGIIYDSIYEFSANPNDTLYNLSFTNVGQGNGNYILINNAANGNEFAWTAPDSNNNKQGSYEPVQLLVTPKKLQIADAGVEYKISDRTVVNTELSLSNYNVNLFSRLNKSEDIGLAGKFQIQNQSKPIILFSHEYKLQTQLGYEYVQSEFKTIEPLRKIEFYRDWSLPVTVSPSDENLSTVSFQLKDKTGNQFQYQVSNYIRSNDFTGYRQQFIHSQKIGSWQVTDQISLTNTNSETQTDYYLRPTIDINKTLKQLKNIQIGAGYSNEYNKLTDKIADTLNALSFAFHTWQAYIKSDQHSPNHWSLTFNTREDKLPIKDNLLSSSRADNISAGIELLKSKKNKIKITATYRDLKIENSLLSSQTPTKTLLERTEYLFNQLNGLLSGNVLYEIGSGQEQKQSFTYLEVPAGQGQYVWHDLNSDGIAELNEFQLAIYQDQANYIRVYTPSGQYVPTNYIQLNYSVDINPQKFFGKEKLSGYKKFLSRISATSAMQLNKKDQSTGNFEYNPFTNNINDTSLISQSFILSNNLYFNRLSTKWGMDISHSINSNKAILTYGYQSSKNQKITLKSRLNINRRLTSNITLNTGMNQLSCPAFSNLNYNILGKGIEPALSYIYLSNFRLTLSYSFNEGNNLTGNHEQALTNAVTANFRYNVLSSGSISGNFTMNHIQYNAPDSSASSTVGYLMLNGLQPGQNYLWGLQFTKRIAGNIEMSIQYDGRKAGDDRIVNTGKATIRAVL